MDMPKEEDDSSVTQSEFLLDSWPTDERAEALPLMNSVLWPLGEQCQTNRLWIFFILLLSGVGLMSLWIERRFRQYMQNYTNPRRTGHSC